MSRTISNVRITLTKLTDKAQRFEITRLDGTTERVELLSRNFLLHDFSHFAVESVASLSEGFFGVLASGTTRATLNDKETTLERGMLQAEQLSAPMQSRFMKRFARELYLENLGAAYPAVVNDTFVDSVLEQLRKLMGEWKATKCGESMVMEWAPPPQADS